MSHIIAPNLAQAIRDNHADIAKVRNTLGDITNASGNLTGDYAETDPYSQYGDYDPVALANNAFEGQLLTPNGDYAAFTGDHSSMLSPFFSGDPARTREEKLAHRAALAARRAGNAAPNSPAGQAQTINRVVTAAKAAAGKRSRADRLRFIDVVGGQIVKMPIPVGAGFRASFRESFIGQSLSRTVYPNAVQTTLPTSGTATVTFAAADVLTGATQVFVPFFFIEFGTNMLAGVPNNLVSISITAKNIDGAALTLSPVTVSFGQAKCILTVGPWQLADNIPLPTMIGLTSANTLVVEATDLAADTRLTVMIPGANHPLISEFLNRFE